ncbi:MAG: rhodanese-like domain-containing protein [Bacteroidetes bacterium]|nr:rhodanese-like domain-containing protein [Bacteroidota bacterium]
MKNFLLFLIFLPFFACQAQQKDNVEEISLAQLKTQAVGQEVQLIDVRTPEEYERGHIDDAVNMNISDSQKFKKQVSQLDKDKPVYVYCHSGNRSGKASAELSEMGFTKIYDFSGGWSTWSEQ